MMVQGSVCVRDYGALSAMAAHEHDQASVNIVVRGGFRESIGRQQRAYARGHAVFCPAGVTHSQRFGEGGARQIVLNPKSEWLDYLADCRVALEESPHVNSIFFAQIGDRLVRELSRFDAYTRLACDGLLLEIIAAFGRGWSVEAKRARPPAWLMAAQEYMHANALGPLCVEEIARAAGRHPIHVCREFRRHFGVSVGAYMRRLRIEEAIRLVMAGGLSLSEIALDCGFSSHAHLCREFRAQLGMTPSQFRAEMRAGAMREHPGRLT